MDPTRRDFLAATARLTAGAALVPGGLPAARPPCRPFASLRAGSVSSPDDPLGVRDDFPITRNRIYLNTAYIAPIPKPVAAAVQAFNEKRMNEPLNVGDLLRQVGATRARFARFINAAPEEVGLLYTTSEGENIVANSIPWQRGDNVVVDDLHYEAAFVIYRQLEKRLGVELRIVPSRNGAAEAKDYEPYVDGRTKLVSVAWVSSVNGYRHDMKAIAEVAHAKGALVYVDAIQAVGMFPVDVQAAGIDVLCCGTYKWLLGGFGVAPLYIRKDVQDRIRPDRFGAFSVQDELPGHRFELRNKSAGKFTYATLPFAEVYQLKEALEYLEKVGVARIEEYTVGLAAKLRAGLVSQGQEVMTPEGDRSSIVSFKMKSDTATVERRLAEGKVDVTVRGSREVRVSPAMFNSRDEIDTLLGLTQR